jgi:hypothetical protein
MPFIFEPSRFTLASKFKFFYIYSYNFMLITKLPEDCNIFLQTFRSFITEHTITILRFLKKKIGKSKALSSEGGAKAIITS